MKTAELMNRLTRSVHRAGLTMKKYSPEILVVTGVVGTVASAVMACKATTKVNFILEETKTQVDIIHKGVEEGTVKSYDENGQVTRVPYSKEDSTKDLTIVYAQTGLKFAKLYGPSVVLGAASIACILGGHNIARKRNIALAAAYTAVDKGFKDYRKRVVDRFGEELDRELKYNIKAKEIQETVTDENGEEKVVNRIVNTVDSNHLGEHDVIFDEYCRGWTKNAELNKKFLITQQNWFNDLLKSRGYVFLNEIYEALGISKTEAGHMVGWVYDEGNPEYHNYIDFGMFDIYDEKKCDFVNGRERSVILNFNPDGIIYKLVF